MFKNVLEQPCILTKQCRGQSEFCFGPTRDDISPEHIVVVALSVNYRSAMNDYAGDVINSMVCDISELLLSHINGQELSCMGQGVTEEGDVIRWTTSVGTTSRIAVIRSTFDSS